MNDSDKMMQILDHRYFFVLIACLFIGGCSDDKQTATIAAIDAKQLARHISILASDDFEGRAPASSGERKTIEYLRAQLRSFGVLPGNGDSYFQAVPLVAITADPNATLNIAASDVTGEDFVLSLSYGEEMMVWTKRVSASVSLAASELMFVGYGIIAPEYDWDDYAGIDVKGKTVVILVNDPGFATQRADLFTGNAMTYYGRWTYKFEEAARQGAAGALIVHQTDAAGYGWDVVTGSWTGEQFDMVDADNNLSRVAVEGWLTKSAATVLFDAAGMNFEAVSIAAASSSFDAQPMGLTVSIALENTIEESISNNVLGLVPGTDLADELVVYLAHWDHLGRDPLLAGDQIYNGAYDNATGTAALLELARVHAADQHVNRRSVLFLAVTAEESGLLGSKYYAENPVFPLAKTVAGINMDGLNVSGRTHDVTVVGFGASELDRYLEAVARDQQRSVVPEPTPEKGFYYRSDHFSLAKYGVPMLYAKAGVDFVGREPAWGRQNAADYVANRYHKPADEYDPAWDLSGMVEDTQLYFEIGRRLANEEKWPNWVEGNEFRGIRDASLR